RACPALACRGARGGSSPPGWQQSAATASGPLDGGRVRVRLRNPDRELEVAGSRTVRDVLSELGIDPDTVLVIRAGTLVTREGRLEDGDEIEVRPVISGGSGP